MYAMYAISDGSFNRSLKVQLAGRDKVDIDYNLDSILFYFKDKIYAIFFIFKGGEINEFKFNNI